MKIWFIFNKQRKHLCNVFDSTNPRKLVKKIFAVNIILAFTCTPFLFGFNGALPIIPSILSVENPILSTPESYPINDSLSSNNQSTNARFLGVNHITTLWIKDDCRNNSLLAQIFILNLIRIDTNQSIEPISIYWDIYNYQGQFINKYNATDVSISRSFEDKTTMYYKITVFVNESYGVCSFTIKKFYTLRFIIGSSQNYNDNPGSNIIPEVSDNIPTSLSNAADILQIISTPLNVYTLIELISRLKNYLRKVRKQKKKIQMKIAGANDDFNKYLSYI